MLPYCRQGVLGPILVHALSLSSTQSGRSLFEDDLKSALADKVEGDTALSKAVAWYETTFPLVSLHSPLVTGPVAL